MNKSIVSITIILLFFCGSCKAESVFTPEKKDIDLIANHIIDTILALKKNHLCLSKFDKRKNISFRYSGKIDTGLGVFDSEYFSINYINGVVKEVDHFPNSQKKRQMTLVYDKSSGIKINIHLFVGKNRGADARTPIQVGPYSLHLYVRGPNANAILPELEKSIRKLQQLFIDRKT